MSEEWKDMYPFLQKDQIYFAGPDSEDGIESGKDYIKRMGFTSDDVRLIRRTEQDGSSSILIIGKVTKLTHHDKEKKDAKQSDD